MDLYMTMHQKLHTTLSSVKILYHIGAKEALLGWVSLIAPVVYSLASDVLSFVIYSTCEKKTQQKYHYRTVLPLKGDGTDDGTEEYFKSTLRYFEGTLAVFPRYPTVEVRC